MKMKKTFLSLLLAVIMTFAAGTSVFATYDQDRGLPPNDIIWDVFEVYHWVVRGDTLQSIANHWGTTVEWIKFWNSDYFRDLELRNKTYGINIQLEPGVRLFIYHMARAQVHVVRGDTLNSIASGKLVTADGYVMRTTPRMLRAQNPVWFNHLDRINTTQNTDFDLIESFAVPDVAEWRPYYTSFLNTYDDFGSRLVITLPVIVDWSGTTPYAYSVVTYTPDRFGTPGMYDGWNVEVIPWFAPDAHLQWNSFNPPPTNPFLINEAGMANPVGGFQGAPVIQYLSFQLYDDPGVRGIIRY